MSDEKKRWEQFEEDACDYIKYLLSDEFYQRSKTEPMDADLRRDLQNLEFIENICDINGVDPYSLTLKLAGGHDCTVSDILLSPADLYVESKMKSAQCGQMVVEQDAFGTFQIATKLASEIAPWDNEDLDPDGELVEETREFFEYEKQGYFQDVKDNFLKCMNELVLGDEGDEREFDGDSDRAWKATRFMFNHPATYEAIYAHYLAKDALFFITKNRTSTYADPSGWLIFPIDYLDNYFDVWACYRHKKSGSSRLPYKNLDDAVFALGIEGETIIEDDEFGLCVDLPSEEGRDDRHTAEGHEGWYKFLAKGEVDGGKERFQLRKLGNSCQPTVVLNLKVKPQSELPEWHR